MIERLVPGVVVVASTREEVLEVELFPEEERSLGRAVEKRRREFVTARACARQALERLGLPRVAVPNGPRGEPLWPSGVVGSITHCASYRACAVARSSDVLTVGIDASVHEPLPEGVWEQVAFGPERQLIEQRGGGVCLDRLLFSAKEAVYKAWFPLAGRWLGFEDAELTVDVGAGTFRARLLVPGPVVGGAPVTEFHGCWCVDAGIVAAAVVALPKDAVSRRRNAAFAGASRPAT